MPDMEWEEFCEFGDDSDAEHYEAICHLPHSYSWIGHSGRPLDLRRAPIQHIQNLALWMEKQDTDNTPYTKLPQYLYVKRRIQRNQAWLDFAADILKNPKSKKDQDAKDNTKD
jgi:hypothetical protein